MGSPIHATPADRLATRKLAAAVLDAIRNDEAMPIGMRAFFHGGGLDQAYDKDDAEALIAQLCGEIVALVADYERMRRQEQHVVNIGNRRIAELEQHLAATQSALDEACDEAKALAWKLHRECPNDADESEHPSTLQRISQLRAAGRVK